MLAEEVKKWPTPSVRDHKGGYIAVGFGTGNLEGYAGCSGTAYGQQRETGGQLNPTWVEWLMGFPQHWTLVE